MFDSTTADSFVKKSSYEACLYSICMNISSLSNVCDNFGYYYVFFGGFHSQTHRCSDPSFTLSLLTLLLL